MIKESIPSINFYDQDFVDLYSRNWVWIEELWKKEKIDGFSVEYLSFENQEVLNQYYSCLSSFFLVYSNNQHPPFSSIDFFYNKQEEDGAIRGEYSLKDGSFIKDKNNPEGVHPPLFAFLEYNFFHKLGNKKRLKEIVVILEKYFEWLENNFAQDNGLYSVPIAACMTKNINREKAYYPIDFNAQLALSSLYMSFIGDILNDKELSFRYKRLYFSIKTKINTLMWDDEIKAYCDLDKKENKIKKRFISSYWTLLAQIPNDDRASEMILLLKDPKVYGSDNPFPSIALDDPDFKETGDTYNGGVSPIFTYVVIKGLQQYGDFDFARECASRHLYFILDTLNPDGDVKGDIWDIYLPNKEGVSLDSKGNIAARKRFLHSVSLVSITLMIENIIGLEISLPKKTVEWTMSTLEVMGIEKLSLKKNNITILCNKNQRGWEIRLESEKLYYFTIDILDVGKKKTLPIPSGRCSILIDKI